MDLILIRDTISNSVTESLKLRSPKILVSDSAILVEANKVFDGDFPHPVVGVSPGFYAHSLPEIDMERYIKAHAEALDEIIEKYDFFVVFLPHHITGLRYDDLEVCKSIISRMQNKRYTTVIEADSVESFKSLLNSMDLVITSKMHPAVLAISGNVPTLCIAYDQKQMGFFKDLGLLECVLPIKSFSKIDLLFKIEHVWGMREQLKTVLSEKVPMLQNMLISAIEVALRTVCGDKLDFVGRSYGQLS
jgi:polysaccharide pyruvyl transferase WcaK-like protein